MVYGMISMRSILKDVVWLPERESPSGSGMTLEVPRGSGPQAHSCIQGFRLLSLVDYRPTVQQICHVRMVTASSIDAG